MSRGFRPQAAALALVLAACGGGGSSDTPAGTPGGNTGGSVGSGGTAPAVTVQQISLVHNAIVYDRVGGFYWATVPGSVPSSGNRLARIDAAGTLMVSSATLGSDPSALAVAADGSAIVIGFDGSGEVALYTLPGLVQQWRVRLPIDPFYGQLLPERIAVSPTDPSLVAVSLRRANVSPRHGGVVLIRAGVLQPRQTQDHTGSNLIAFDRTGAALYGFNNETTEFGLRRIGMVADGLVEQAVVTTGANFSVRNLDAVAGGVLLERWVYGTPSLLLQGQSGSNTRACRPATAGTSFVCVRMDSNGFDTGQIAVVDATSYVTGATPSFWLMSVMQQSPVELIPGSSGQVALRIGVAGSAPYAIWLMNSTELP